MAIHRVISFYKRYEKPFSSLSLIGGFVFDALTLRRVDTFWENFWIIIHLLVVAAAILVINRSRQNETEKSKEIDFWMVNILQFAFGGLLSAFLVFYFRSGSLAVSWPFLLLLALAFVSNERLKSHFNRLVFQISLLFISIFSFAIFFVPVVLHTLGDLVFVFSGVVSLVVIRLFVVLLEWISKDRVLASRKLLRVAILTIFVAVNILYFTNILPAIPLSLKDGGIFHSLTRDKSGQYTVEREPQGVLGFLKFKDVLHVRLGDPLYAYTAIFSPTKISTNIVHEWQHYDESTKSWLTTSHISLPIFGGREEGYRTYSISNILPGKWRVNVETPSGRNIGRISFTVEAGETDLVLMSETR